MINTTTLVQHYIEFCKQSSIPVKPTPDGFLKLTTNSFFLPVFISYVLSQGYVMQDVEDWEEETFNGEAESFFKDIEYAFEILGDNL